MSKIGYQIIRKKKLQMTKDYQTNINKTDDFKLVKQGGKMEDREWPFTKILNDFGPILKFDQEFTYFGDDLFVEIN